MMRVPIAGPKTNAFSGAHLIFVVSVRKCWSSTQDIEELRAEKIAGIRDEAIKRIGLKVNAIKEIDMTAAAVFSYQHIWPAAGASPELIEGKAVYDYAKTKLTQARSADRGQLESYDPATDQNWP